MKTTYKTIILTFVILLISCLSAISQEVISNGITYEVKGKAIFKDGKEITQALTPKEKKGILKDLDNKIKTDKRAEKVKKQAEKEHKKAEKEIKKQKAAHDDFEKYTKKLEDAENKYQKLKRKGKLSPHEEEKMLKKIKSIKEDLAKYKKRI